MEELHKELLRAVKDYETREIEQASHTDVRKDRLLVKLAHVYQGPVVKLQVALKELKGKPKFLTFTILEPKKASFIFFSYDANGKRFFNRKMFDKMYDFLQAESLTYEFLELLRSETFEE